MRFANEADTVFSNFYETKLSPPNCAIGFLHLRPVLLSSLVFPSLPILINPHFVHYLRCKDEEAK